MTNPKLLAEELTKRCDGVRGKCVDGNEQRHCTGRHAKGAAIYPQDLCLAILKGIVRQLAADGMVSAGTHGTIPSRGREEEIHAGIKEPTSIASGCYKDDITGQILVDPLIVQARKVEMDYFEQK